MPALADLVENYWYFKFETNGASLQQYHTPIIQCLAFNFYTGQDFHAKNNKVFQLDKHFYFFGQQTSSRVLGSNDKRVHALGVKFKPLGIAKLTGINMEHMANNIISAEDIWGAEVETLSDEIQSAPNHILAIKVLENFLFKKFIKNKWNPRMNAVDHALSMIEASKGNIIIRDLYYETNASRKTLERGFVNYLGITPKLYSQIVRFNAAKFWLDNNNLNQNLSGLAFDMAYSDGSHLSAEFKRFSNMTPLEYLQNRKENIPVI